MQQNFPAKPHQHLTVPADYKTNIAFVARVWRDTQADWARKALVLNLQKAGFDLPVTEISSSRGLLGEWVLVYFKDERLEIKL